MTTEIEEVVNFYQSFDKYKHLKKKLLRNHLTKSFEYKQYKIHRKDNKIVAFTNWIFLSKEHEDHFENYGQILNHFWNSGDRCWIIDSVSDDSYFNMVYDWAKTYFGKELQIDSVSWLKVGDDYKVNSIHKKYNRKEYR